MDPVLGFRALVANERRSGGEVEASVDVRDLDPGDALLVRREIVSARTSLGRSREATS